MSLIRSSLALVAVVVLLGCASAGGPRHVAAVSILTAHSTLAAIQDTEALVVCGTATAPPTCLPVEAHRAFAAQLVVAFDLDARILREVRAWPAGSPLPPSVVNALTQLRAIVADLLALLPPSTQTDRLLVTLGGL